MGIPTRLDQNQALAALRQVDKNGDGNASKI